MRIVPDAVPWPPMITDQEIEALEDPTRSPDRLLLVLILAELRLLRDTVQDMDESIGARLAAIKQRLPPFG